ncbi:MAG: DnaJ domain-containing protein, partial [Desulfuromonadales bacterium]
MFDPITFGIGIGLWKIGEYIYKGVKKTGIPHDPEKDMEVEELAKEPIYLVVAILAKFAKADGVISKNEIACVEEILREIELTGKKRAAAIGIFTKHKAGVLTYEESLNIFAALTKNSADIRGTLCLFLLRLACADGDPTQPSINGVKYACSVCAIDYNQVQEAYHEQEQHQQSGDRTLRAAYEIMGCSLNDSMDAIKARYRHLVKIFHPDTLSGKDLPPEFATVAKDKFCQIQNAYEFIVALKSTPHSTSATQSNGPQSQAPSKHTNQTMCEPDDEDHQAECPVCGELLDLEEGTGLYECMSCGSDFEVRLLCPFCQGEVTAEAWEKIECPYQDCKRVFDSWENTEIVSTDVEVEVHAADCPACGETVIVNDGTGIYECTENACEIEITLNCPECGRELEVEEWGGT